MKERLGQIITDLDYAYLLILGAGGYHNDLAEELIANGLLKLREIYHELDETKGDTKC